MNNPQHIYTMYKLSKVYPGGKQVIKDMSLSFLPGAKIGVLGGNGAGKSTLLKIMAGVDSEYNGEAKLADGIKVGYLAQEPELNNSLNVLKFYLPMLIAFANLLTQVGDEKLFKNLYMIKPDNFVIGFGESHNNIFLIDFGLSISYINTETMQHREYQHKHQFTGSIRYSSINNHKGIQQVFERMFE